MDERIGRVLRELWQGTEGYVFFPSKDPAGMWREATPIPWPDTPLENVVIGPEGADHYFSPLVFSAAQRRSERALPTHVLWADLDGARPQDCRLIPSIAWRTTQGGFCSRHLTGSDKTARWVENVTDEPHYQALWLLKRGHDVPEGVEDWTSGGLTQDDYDLLDEQWGLLRHRIAATEAAALSRRIAYGEQANGSGADKGGWDVTQVLRLPGTVNHKHRRVITGPNGQTVTWPQKVKLLWAKRLYYTVEQVRAAYPPVPQVVSSSNGWPQKTGDEILKALYALPIGVRRALQRDNAGADRSLELVRMARVIINFGIDPEMVPLLLQRSPLNKFAGRSDEHQRLLTAVADALLDSTTL